MTDEPDPQLETLLAELYVLDSLGLPPGKEGEPDFGEAKEQ